jgi:uncharacterized protein (TIGR02646 family)
MILIVKPSAFPLHLLRRGVKQTRLDCKSFDLCPDEYLSGRKRFPKFKNSIYNAEQVKEALLKAQYNKCCYCESRLINSRDLAIEHFRPKGEVRQMHNDTKEYPGYYWLAYEWDNLLLSCNGCNSDHKGILFPLANPAHRARSHHDDISLEQPLFVHPAQQNPRDHIRFEDDAPIAVTPIGGTTIEEIGLRRNFLRNERLNKLRKLDIFLEIVEGAEKNPQHPELQSLAGKARAFLEAAILPSAQYSSMAQDFILKRRASLITSQSN